jgi:hypothetical protein
MGSGWLCLFEIERLVVRGAAVLPYRVVRLGLTPV